MNTEPEIAVWAITPGGLRLAQKLTRHLKKPSLILSERLSDGSDAVWFRRLSEAVTKHFDQFDGHVFIMSTGIVVRMIAKEIQNKTMDPAVVVVDDTGRFAISLLSGHLGGGNALAKSVVDVIGGIPVITTATDVNHLPSIDMIAKKRNLVIENPSAIKYVNMAILLNQSIYLDDPYKLITDKISGFIDNHQTRDRKTPMVVVDDRVADTSTNTLLLRPKSLAVGIGCNRDTPLAEIREFLFDVCNEQRLSLSSVVCIATIDIKKKEAGILELGKSLGIPIIFYNKETLNQVDSIQNPSNYAEKYTGAQSVCEAAAILAADTGDLIVSKKKTRNVTIAIARKKIYFTL